MKKALIVIAVLVGGYQLFSFLALSWFKNEFENVMIISLQNGEFKQLLLEDYGDNPRFKSALNRHYDACTEEPVTLAQGISDAEDRDVISMMLGIQSSLIGCVSDKSGKRFSSILKEIDEAKSDFLAERDELG